MCVPPVPHLSKEQSPCSRRTADVRGTAVRTRCLWRQTRRWGMAPQGLRSHLSGTLPISIAVHVAALLALFIIPLAADMVLPVVQVSLPDYMPATAVPP